MLDAVDVVVRSRNEMPRVVDTLAALARQRSPRAEVLFIDNGSTDGSREAAADHAVRILDHPGPYVPGEVLNLGMASTRSPVVVFCNGDAVPRGDDALAHLLRPFAEDAGVAATYGRQIARADASPLTRSDHERAYGGEAPLPTRRGFFFSMAASAIRRNAWQGLPFDEELRFSEDVDWVQRAAALGWTTRYAPAAEFEKSREYDLRAAYRRRRGEGTADRRIFRLGPHPSWVGDLLRPLVGSLTRDWRSGHVSVRGLALRTAQAAGYFRGRRRSSF